MDPPAWRHGCETSRLRLRPIEVADEDMFCGLYTDAETMRFICKPLTPERARRWFRRILAEQREPTPPSVFFAVVEKGSRQAIGVTAIAQFDTRMTRAEVGIVLESKARSKGFAREGLGGLVGLVFRAFPVDEVWVQCSSLNPVVERMVDSIGFRASGLPGSGTSELLERIWSLRRPSTRTNAAINLGEENVERDRLS